MRIGVRLQWDDAGSFAPLAILCGVVLPITVARDLLGMLPDPLMLVATVMCKRALAVCYFRACGLVSCVIIQNKLFNGKSGKWQNNSGNILQPTSITPFFKWHRVHIFGLVVENKVQAIDAMVHFLGDRCDVVVAFCIVLTTYTSCAVVSADGRSRDALLRDDFGGVAGHSESTLVYNTAASHARLRLVHQDATVEQLASTEDDVQYYGIAVAAGASNKR